MSERVRAITLSGIIALSASACGADSRPTTNPSHPTVDCKPSQDGTMQVIEGQIWVCTNQGWMKSQDVPKPTPTLRPDETTI